VCNDPKILLYKTTNRGYPAITILDFVFKQTR
jgi:hypothetical protein